MKKLRPNHLFTYITFSILLIALEFLLWGICGTKPWVENPAPWWVNLIYTGCAIILIGTATLIYVLKVYYTIDNDAIYRHGNKVTKYSFREIVYVDEEYAYTHIDMKIYLNRGTWVLLTMDKNKELLKIIKEKSPLLDKENFIYKYPEAFNKLKK